MFCSRQFLFTDVIFNGRDHPDAPDAAIGWFGGMDMSKLFLMDLMSPYG
jgi:hypothetical protein